METSGKAAKIIRKRKRIKLECLVCHHEFDDDYRSTHNKTFHSALISQHKAIPYKVVNAPKNPFEAAKKAYQKSEESHTLITSPSSSIKTVAMEDSAEANDGTQEVSERYETSSPTVTCTIDSEVTEQPKSDMQVQFIKTTASNAILNTNTAENLSRGSISGTAATVNLESEFGNELIEENATDESPNWLTCAGELSFLVENLKLASNLLEDVKGDNCPLIEVFLTSAEEITRNISQTANKVNKTCTVLLREINEKRKEIREERASVPSYDPSDRSKITTTSGRKYIMKLGPHQPKLPIFPRNEDIPAKKQCRFSSQWYTVYPHLEYSISQDAAFCFVCSLFPSGPGREMADNAWSSVGVRSWHKMTSCGSNSKRKTGKLAKHFSSKAHKSALADFYAFSHDSSNVDMLLNKEKRVNAIQEKEDHLVNEGAACILLDVARTLARQGLAFRGSSTHEHGESDGNFYQIVHLCQGIAQVSRNG